jgi:histidine kinase
MRLATKLFLSYLAIAVLTLLTLAIAASLLAPQNFSRMMHHDDAEQMSGRGMSGMMDTLDSDLDATFRQSVNNALLVAGIVSVITAGVLSWFVSRRIVKPIRTMAAASQQFAHGNYEQHLDLGTQDELQELATSLNVMARELSQIENLRRQLIADVSHELKTPLSSINGLMEGLQDGVIESTPATFQLVRDETRRLQRLVNDLQELSLVEADTIPIEQQRHNPQALVEPILAKMRPQFEDKGITLILQFSPDLPDVYADADRTSQVLTNLLGNALQYTPPAGQVTVTLRDAPQGIQFSVCDTGIGIDSHNLSKIFQRFYRVDKSRSRASGGSGIGLTIAQRLIMGQGGLIWAESDGVDKGSAFHFILPTSTENPIVTKSS